MRHFYWAVTSTEESLHSGKLKLAKFQSFLSHVINKHKNLPNTMFKACAHGNITKPKVWMSKGTKIHVYLQGHSFVYDLFNQDLTGLHFECPDCKPFTFVQL